MHGDNRIDQFGGVTLNFFSRLDHFFLHREGAKDAKGETVEPWWIRISCTDAQDRD